jgi:WD40 repeat protein
MSARFLAWFIAALAISAAPAIHGTDNSRAAFEGESLPAGAIVRLGTLRLKSKGELLRSVVFSPDGKKVASLSSGGEHVPYHSLQLWDTATGREIFGPWSDTSADYYATVDFSVSVAFSPDSSTLAAICEGWRSSYCNIKHWDIAARQELQWPKSVQAWIRRAVSLAFEPDGKTLVLGDDYGNRFDVNTGKEKPDWGPWPFFEAAGDFGTLKITHFVNPFSLLSPNARYVAVLFSEGEDPRLPRTDFPDPQLKYVVAGFDLATATMRWRITTNISSAYKPVAFSADEKRVAILIGQERIELRDTATGKLLDILPLPSGSETDAGMAISPDGHTVAISARGGQVFLWDSLPSRSGLAVGPDKRTATLRHFKGRVTSRDPSKEIARALAFSPNGKMLAVGAGSDIQLYELATLKEVNPWPGHRCAVEHVAFSSDGQQLWTGCAAKDWSPNEVATWQVGTWKQLELSSTRAPLWPNVGVPSPERQFYVGKHGEDRFRLYEMKSGQPIGRFPVPPGQDSSSRGFFLPEGRFYVLAGTDEDGKAIERLYAVPSCQLVCKLPALAEAQYYRDSRQISICSDGRLLALFDPDDSSIRVIETATGKTCQRLRDLQIENRECIGNLAVSPDGKHLAAFSFSEPTLVRLWDLTTGKQLPPFICDGKKHSTMALAWSPDGRMLAMADLKIQLWEVASGKLRHEFAGHECDVRSLAFSPDGRLLASGSADTTVLIWEVFGKGCEP